MKQETIERIRRFTRPVQVYRIWLSIIRSLPVDQGKRQFQEVLVRAEDAARRRVVEQG